MQILEAFRALNALNEDVFSLDADGVKGLSDFKNNDDFEDDISIIDPEAETTEDLQDNYIGKVILDCCVCHSKLYKAKEDVTIDETGELVNVGEECPYCFTPDGFKVIGEVAAFEAGEDKDEDGEEEEPIEELLDVNLPVTANVTANGNDVAVGGAAGGLGESLKEGIFGIKTKKEKQAEKERQDEMDAYEKKKADDARKAQEWRDWCAQSQKNGEERERRERAEREARAASRRSSSSSSRSSSSPSNTGKAGVYYSGGDYYSESLEEGIFDKNPSHVLVVMYDENNREKKGQDGYIMAASSDVEKLEARAEELHASYQKHGVDTEIKVVPYKDALKMNIVDGTKKGIKTSVKRHNMDKKNDVNESIEDLSMTANDTHVEVGEDENGKVTVTMEPATADGGEMIAPVSDETEAELMATEEEAPVEGEEPVEDEVDIEVDEVDEESVDELGESYLKRVYENVNSFKTTTVRQKNNSLIVEGKIKFNNGKVRKTSFMFEALDATKAGKVRFVGDNKHLTEGKKAFMLTGKIKGNKLIAESLNYNYKHRDAEGKVSRVYGTERTSRR